LRCTDSRISRIWTFSDTI